MGKSFSVKKDKSGKTRAWRKKQGLEQKTRA
jgi:hypothetical protein